MIIYTVEVPSCATTCRKRPPPISDHAPIQNTKIFQVKALQLERQVNDHFNHFLDLTVNDFLLFLTSFKRPFDAFSDLYFRCVYVTVLRVYEKL